MNPARPLATPDARLQRLLGGEELAALRLRLRRYFERRAADADAQDRVLHLGKLSATEYAALTQLMGHPARPSRAATSSRSLRLDIVALDALLRSAGIASTLRDALEQLDGPLVNRALAREAVQALWAEARSARLSHAALRQWLQTTTALHLLKRLTRQDPGAARPLLERANAVLHKLPAQGLTRAQLAADTLGNAHALDNGQATATLVLAVLQQGASNSETAPPADVEPDAAQPDHSAEVGAPGNAETEGAAPPAAERTRDIWARAGVLVNELARPALFLNLPTQASAPLQPVAGEPGFLSLRQLLRSPSAWAVADLPVFVCENPNIVSIAADRLGAACAPLVCTEGMPAAAQRVLLMQLASAGARLRYHGDFDWAGLQIANHVMALCGAQPWRMGCGDYVQALKTAAHTERDLGDSAVSAGWDAQLAHAMRRHGLAIAEEAVVSALLQDLTR